MLRCPSDKRQPYLIAPLLTNGLGLAGNDTLWGKRTSRLSRGWLIPILGLDRKRATTVLGLNFTEVFAVRR